MRDTLQERWNAAEQLRDQLAAVIREHARALDEKPYKAEKVKQLQHAAKELRAALKKERK